MGRRGTNAGPPRVALALGLCALLTLLAPLLLARDAPPRIDAQELARVVDRQNRTISLLQEQLRRPAAPPPRREPEKVGSVREAEPPSRPARRDEDRTGWSA